MVSNFPSYRYMSYLPFVLITYKHWVEKIKDVFLLAVVHNFL